MYNGKMIKAISYGDHNYSMSLKLNLITARLIGKVDKVEAFTPNHLSQDFCKKNAEILNMKRGGGYWMWKPYIMLEALRNMEYGEYLIYTDAGLIYISSINKIIDQIERDKSDIFLTSGFAPNKEWCKRDAFILMDCDNEEAKNRPQISGGYILVKKSETSIEFLQQWLMYNEQKEIITDSPNICGFENDPNFHEHRHDQAILTNLAYKNGIISYKGVTHVDEPRAHRKAINGNVGAYGYSFEKRMEWIRKKHKEPGYIKATYGRIFINTRIRNCNIVMFIIRLGWAIIDTIKTDIWGTLFDQKYLEGKK